MSVYDTRQIDKVKIVMLKGQDGAGSYTAGNGIDLTNNVITNTKPGIDYQAGNGISISGDTITNSAPMPENPLATSHGGTGNADGYIRTGAASGSTIGSYATIEGAGNTASDDYAHAEGYQNTASGSSSHAEGWANTASNSNAHAEGSENEASGENSHVEGWYNTASGDSSHAEGVACYAEGNMSHVEGSGNVASGIASHAEGGFYNSGDNNTASGDSSHAEGASTTASGNMSHAEGYQTTASEQDAHAEGSGTTASNAHAHAEGYHTTASGNSSHAGGTTSVASGLHSFAHGQYVNAGSAQQTAFGRYNDNKSTNLFEIGNGTADNARSNAMEVTADGHVLDGNGNDLQSVAALEQSASGNPIVVNAQPVDAKELSVELEPSQDLHGLPFPYVGGAYKNKLPMTVSAIKALNTGGTWSGNDYTFNGVKFTILTDSANNIIGISADGITSENHVMLKLGQLTLQGGIGYTLTGCPSGGSLNGYRLSNFGSNTVDVNDLGSGATITVSNDESYTFMIYVKNSGTVLSDITFYPMLRLSTVTDPTFAPYSNECPISGRTQVGIARTGKNLVDIDNAVNYEKYSGGIRNGFEFSNCKGTYTISQSVTTNNVYFAYQTTGGAWVESSITPSSLSATFSGVDGKIQIWVASGATIKAQSPYLQLEVGSQATAFEPYKGITVTIQLGQTVYGGSLNVTTGVMTVDKTIEDLGELNWTYSSYYGFYTTFNGKNAKTPINNDTVANIISSVYKASTFNDVETHTGNGKIALGTSGNNILILVNNDSYNDAATFKTAMSGQTICYELATPTTVQLTPEQLTMLKGYNRLSSDGEMQLVYIPESVLPIPPTADGTYKLRCTVSNGVPVFGWVSDT